MKKLALLIPGIIAVGAAATACQAQVAAAPQQPTSAPATSPAVPASTPAFTPPPTPSGPDQLAVSQSETLIDTSSGATEGTVTVLSGYETAQPADTTYGRPPANGYYIVIRIKVTADKSYTSGFRINPLDFYALSNGQHFDDISGNAVDALTTTQSSQEITFTTLAAGESSTGWESFDVPSVHGEIVYAPNFDGQPLAEWRY